MKQLPTPLINFLSEAFGVPSELRMEILMEFDDLEERNRITFDLICAKYFQESQDLSNEESLIKARSMSESELREVLSHAVYLHYIAPYLN